MKLKDLVETTLAYSSEYGIWAELIDGEFTLESQCRIGQFQFDNGGLVDDWQPFASNQEVENFVHCYWDDRSEPGLDKSEDPDYDWLRKEAISELILEKNQELTKSYMIIFNDNTGSSAIDAIAYTVLGTWRNTVSDYDGEGHDIGFVDFPAEFESYLQQLLTEDENVVEFSEA